jgi:hypothetical protein
MHPYLIMVLAGYAAFVCVLAVYWLRQYVSEIGGPAKSSDSREKDDHGKFRNAA